MSGNDTPTGQSVTGDNGHGFKPKATAPKATAPKATAPKATAPKATAPSKTDLKAYQTAVRQGQKILAAQGRTNWQLGDLAANLGTVAYGAKTLQRFATDLDVEYKSLLNMRTVSDAYAEADRSANSWTVHMIFAGQSDRVELVSREKMWTVSEARAEVSSRNATDEIPEETNQSDDSTPAEVDEIEATKANIARLEGELEAARAHLAKLEAALPAPAPATLHTGIRGIPEHDVSDNRADCPACKLATSPRTSRTRKTA